nr:RnfABCDGE type electron transport complex subunit G [uncultured Blautia sp.]
MSILKDTVSITVITLVAGLALGVVQDITADPIAQQKLKAKQEAYKAVFPEAESFGEVVLGDKAEELAGVLSENGYGAQNIDEVMTALDALDNEIGYAFTVTTSEGYGGDIQFAMGVQNDGTLNGISILSIGETAGLGMKADTDAFKDQFKNKKVEKFIYTKNGASSEDEIDALSGATITTNAMTNGVNAGLCAFQYMEGGAQ